MGVAAGTAVFVGVGGAGVLVGVLVDGTGVLGGVLVGGTAVIVGVLVGGTGVLVGVLVLTGVPVLVGTGVRLGVGVATGPQLSDWKKSGITAAERFAYDYSDPELAEWVPRIESLADDADDVHVMFNNCYSDYGVRNAATLAALLA